jgi:FtsH-binding integral membrane protein
MTDYSNNTYEASIASNFIRSVYSYMFIAMAVSGVIAYAVGTNKVLFDQLFMTSDGKTSILFYVLLFAPLVISMVIQWGFQRLSMTILLALFVAYSASMGSTLSVIFLAYSTQAIAFTFFVTA